MKNRLLAAVLIFLFSAGLGFGQEKEHFYNVDTEVTFRGVVKNIHFEPRYKDRAPFVIILFEEKKNQKMYTVEISPSWFLTQDLHQGEDLKITGSIYSDKEGNQNVIARRIQFQGETLILRDKHGFPQWRGGPKGELSKMRKGKRF